MPTFLIGLIAGISLAVLFGWMSNNTDEIKQLRSENFDLKGANQKLISEVDNLQITPDPNRPLAQPARPFGGGGSSGTRRLGSDCR